MNIKNCHRLVLIKSMNVMMMKTKIMTSINSDVGRVQYCKVDADVDDHDCVMMMITKVLMIITLTIAMKMMMMTMQVFPTYLMAGCGMVCAGLMLDLVTDWPAFKVSSSSSSYLPSLS